MKESFFRCATVLLNHQHYFSLKHKTIIESCFSFFKNLNFLAPQGLDQGYIVRKQPAAQVLFFFVFPHPDRCYVHTKMYHQLIWVHG